MIFNIPSYQRNAERISKLFRDRPQSALETGIFWTEYVIRHGGAPHLRSAAVDLPWYQYLLLDVLTLMLGFVLFIVFIIVYFVKFISVNLCRRKSAFLKKTLPKQKCQ